MKKLLLHGVNGGYALHDAHLVCYLRSPQCCTTGMGLSWTAYSVVSPLLASRLALVRLWCLGFLFGCTEVPGYPLFAGPSVLQALGDGCVFGWFPLPGLPGYLLCRILHNWPPR